MEDKKNQLENKNVCIYVVGHKAFSLPVKDSIHIPLIVGNHYSELPTGYLLECNGDNIAEKNMRYNELTGLYWVWKNSQTEIVGLCHYRRYFTTVYGKWKNIVFGKNDILISEERITHLLRKYDVILHNKTFLQVGNQEQLCVHEYDNELVKKSKLSRPIIEMMNDVFARKYPEDIWIYEKIMKRKYAHLLNVMICRKTLIDKYCEWLFPLLFSVEKELDLRFPAENHARSIGLFGERLLDVWVEKEGLRVKECFTINTERVDWKIW